jgi:hypothetical protein
LLLPLVEKSESNDSSDWPGQPVRTLNSKELKLLDRIGQGGPMANVRSFVLEHLDGFLEIYKNRPDKTNTCGMSFTQSLGIYIVAKRLQPKTIVESGVNSGQSTYVLSFDAPVMMPRLSVLFPTISQYVVSL